MLWGALNNATQAMMATSWDLGTISQNVANVNTVGYKRKESLFKTVLSESHAGPASPNGLDIFTVRASDRYHITNQGVLAPSSHWSDLAINGRGFFMMAPPATGGLAPTSVNTSDPNAVFYTRAGTFRQVAGAGDRNYFVGESGYHLLGWQADNAGNLGTTLEPVYTLPQTMMDGKITTTAQVIGNLPSDARETPGAGMKTLQFTSANLGGPQDVTFNLTRTGPTTWSVTTTAPTAAGVTGGSFSFDIDPYGNISTTPANTTVTFDWGGGEVVAETVNFSSLAPSSPSLEKLHLPVFDGQFQEHTLALSFEKAGANTWYMHLEDGTAVQLDFNSDGQLLTPSPVTVTATLTSGTPPVTTTQDVAIDLAKMTQFTGGELYVRSIEQDGYASGQLRQSYFTEDGDLMGSFTNGQTRRLFRVPVATFVSENNLNPLSGTLFQRTKEAGDITVSAVGATPGGGSSMTANAVESSTVDIEDEFTRMIMTQKAYSTNATVFRTADEMTTTVRDLKG